MHFVVTPLITHPQEVALGLAADVGTLQRMPKVMGNDRCV